MQLLTKLRQIFDRGTKIKLLLLLAAITAGALLETISLSLISPFVAILLDNSMIEANQYVAAAYHLLDFPSANVFLAFLAFLLAGIYIVRGVYLYGVSKAQYRFIARRQANISGRLLQKILDYSYLYHTKKNLAELQRIVVLDVGEMFGLITSSLLMLSDLVMVLIMVVYLTVVSPLITLAVIAMALICVLLYFRAFRKKIRAAGDKSRDAQIGMNKSVNQALGGIKEVKLLRREKHFYRAFILNSDRYVDAYTQYVSLNAVPKLVIESVCFGGAFLLLAAFMAGGTDVSGLVPQFSVFVLAAFRLLPAVSRQMTYFNNIIYYRPSVDAVYKSLFDEGDDVTPLPETFPLQQTQDITVSNVTFRYPNTQECVLENVSLTIPNKQSVAFIGPSGAGKTTLADLILGVLVPETGGVYYKGKSIHHNFGEWSGCVGYIPQQIYLLDESVLENVAFGIDRAQVDEARVWRALEQAQLADFVRAQSAGLATIVGDRGIRLSGGQRQRIGIARAMYEDPPILVLDEATSSLDSDTERAVMDAVMGFQGNKTMIIIAHRLSTIEHCDIIYRVESQTVVRER